MVAASLSTLFLALAVAATPLERSTSLTTLPFVKRVNDGVFSIHRLDKIRVDFLSGIGCQCSEQFSSPADNRAFHYVSSVGVGDPPTDCK